MYTFKRYFTVLLSIPIAGLLLCSDPVSNDGTGSTTETANATIYEADGKTPAKNAVVQFIPHDNLSNYLSKKTAGKIYSTITDDRGRYSADSIPAGCYNIFAMKEKLVCYAESVIVNTGAILPSDTLNSPGSLKGVVRLSPEHDSRHVLILIFGTNSIISPDDSVGNFSMNDFAEGNYKVRFLVTGGSYDYAPMDTVFHIVSGKEFELSDTIFLKQNLIDPPKNIQTNLLGSTGVKITWKSSKEAIVYTVFRSKTDTGNFSNIGNTVDTFYEDKGLENGTVYYYKIQSSNSMSVSPFSESFSVLTIPAAPQNVTVQAVTDSLIKITFSKVKGADGYKIYVEKAGVLHDSIMVTDTTDTLVGYDYKDGFSFSVKAYNISGNSAFSSNIAAGLGAIISSPPLSADTDFISHEPLNLLYDTNNYRYEIDSGASIKLIANNISYGISFVNDSNGYVPGENGHIYSFSQLITEIQRFLQDKIDSHITVTRKPNNIIQINNPVSSNSAINFSLNIPFRGPIFEGRIGAGDSLRSINFKIRSFRPVRRDDLIKNVYNINHLPLSSPKNGLENGAVIEISGSDSTKKQDFTYSQATSTLNDLLESIRNALDLPLYDETPEKNYSVDLASDSIFVNYQLSNSSVILPGSIVVRFRPGYSSGIYITVKNSNLNNTPYNFTSVMHFLTNRDPQQ